MELPAFFKQLYHPRLVLREFAFLGKEFVAGDGFGFPLYDHVGKETRLNLVLRHLVGFSADHDVGVERFVGGLKTGGLIYGVAHHGVLKLFVGAHVACGNLSCVDAHSGVYITTVFGLELLLKGLKTFLLFQGRPAGFPGVGVGVGIDPNRDSEVGHNGIA